MKTVIIFLSIFVMTWPSNANACDDYIDAHVFLTGAISTLGSTVIFPLVGLAMDNRENPPYWRAVGLTAAASSLGALLAFSTLEDSDCDVEFGYTGYPVVFGTVSTYLTYRYASRRTEKSSNALWQYAPQVSVSPIARGGSLRFNWNF